MNLKSTYINIMKNKKSHIIVTYNIEEEIDVLKNILPQHFVRIITNSEKDNKEKDYLEFKIENAKEVIKEAFLASDETKYIILAAKQFNIYAQNSLLKILEEPPKNIVFILITESKSSILPTIHSRLQLVLRQKIKRLEPLDINIDKLDLRVIYEFLQQNQRLSKIQAKELIESLYLSCIKSNIVLNQKQLDNFSRAIKLIELNSRPFNVLTHLLLSIITNK